MTDQQTLEHRVTALAPEPEPFDHDWSQQTLRRILASDRAGTGHRHSGPDRAAVWPWPAWPPAC